MIWHDIKVEAQSNKMLPGPTSITFLLQIVLACLKHNTKGLPLYLKFFWRAKFANGYWFPFFHNILSLSEDSHFQGGQDWHTPRQIHLNPSSLPLSLICSLSTIFWLFLLLTCHFPSTWSVPFTCVVLVSFSKALFIYHVSYIIVSSDLWNTTDDLWSKFLASFHMLTAEL